MGDFRNKRRMSNVAAFLITALCLGSYSAPFARAANQCMNEPAKSYCVKTKEIEEHKTKLESRFQKLIYDIFEKYIKVDKKSKINAEIEGFKNFFTKRLEKLESKITFDRASQYINKLVELTNAKMAIVSGEVENDESYRSLFLDSYKFALSFTGSNLNDTENYYSEIKNNLEKKRKEVCKGAKSVVGVQDLKPADISYPCKFSEQIPDVIDELADTDELKSTELWKLTSELISGSNNRVDCRSYTRLEDVSTLTQPFQVKEHTRCEKLALGNLNAQVKEECKKCGETTEPGPSGPVDTGEGVRIVRAIYGKRSRVRKTKEEIKAERKYNKDNNIKAKVNPYKDEYIYKKGDYCDAGFYFRIGCEYISKSVKYCIIKASGELATEDMCPDTPPADAKKVKQLGSKSEFVRREGNNLLEACSVEIDKRKICGGFIPAVNAKRETTIEYKCKTDSPVLQVSPAKRDNDVAFLVCSEDHVPEDYKTPTTVRVQR